MSLALPTRRPFGFSADIERGTVGAHVDGIENASVKAYMKAGDPKKGCPCNVRHGWGYCPRTSLTKDRGRIRLARPHDGKIIMAVLMMRA